MSFFGLAGAEKPLGLSVGSIVFEIFCTFSQAVGREDWLTASFAAASVCAVASSRNEMFDVSPERRWVKSASCLHDGSHASNVPIVGTVSGAVFWESARARSCPSFTGQRFPYPLMLTSNTPAIWMR